MQVMEACLKEPCKDYIITSLWRKLTTAWFIKPRPWATLSGVLC
jgi:hypothetical protein